MKTQRLLREYDYRPKKRMAQHFLVQEDVVNRIVQLARLSPADTVVEIGAGPGNLTRRLLRWAGKVYAIESDEELSLILKAELKAAHLEVVQADALQVDYHAFAPPEGRLKVVANLPYNITTPLLFKLLETPEIFSEMLLLVQAEVGRRITAHPGTKDYGILAVFTQLLAETEIVLEVKPSSFRPRPKVNSTLVRLSMREQPLVQINNPALFRKLVRTAFNKRRKTIKNALTKSPELGQDQEAILSALEMAKIDPGVRPEALPIEQFARLADELTALIKQPQETE